ncbi:phosphate acetyltransferase [Oligella sp. MSHR50489EDL]|uniref:phosphate acetyltransferase n=1 Tax=Oligella sp. MSHR50489EDL TaxID=3139409 RepID=UPI003D81B00F
MSILQQIINRAKQAPATITLCEAEDIRILNAALKAQNERIAKIILVGDENKIQNKAKEYELDISHLEIQDTKTSKNRLQLVNALVKQRAHKGMTAVQAEHALDDPLCFANMMVHSGLAKGSVAGAVYSTADVVRNALQLIGKRPDTAIVSSFFLMLLKQSPDAQERPVIFSDCGLIINPDAEELAAITIAASKSAKDLLNVDPRIAMLSFSTAGSAKHPAVDKVTQAVTLIKDKHPNIAIDGEVQFDAAFVPDIAAKKIKHSNVNGQANVFIFPNLDAGNISYKIAERIGGATAIGPLLQGLQKPANDLSRGCHVNDIFYVIAITSLQAQSVNN